MIIMKTCTKCHIKKDMCCFCKRSSAPDGYAYECRACVSKYRAVYNVLNKGAISSSGKRRYNNDSTRIKQQTNDYYHRNKEKLKTKLASYKKKNRVKNRARNLADVQLRHARKLQRTPLWYDDGKVKLIYAEARRIKDGGDDVHVDHIVPLQGSLVSGLHVHNNLQIISAKQNMSKGNKYAV